MLDRYGPDVLSARAPRPQIPEVHGEVGMVVECAVTGWCGEITGWEPTSVGWVVSLVDRHERRRLFPALPAAFLLEGEVVTLIRPAATPAKKARTASGSVAAPAQRALVARDSRIWVEGTHDAELIERVWGDDLRAAAVVVEPLGGIDDLLDVIPEFAPGPSRRLAVLVDHLVPGSKESRIAAQVRNGWSPHVIVLGHPYVDVWQVVRPRSLGIAEWPRIPPGQPWKESVCAALGWPIDTPAAWRRILSRVQSLHDLEPSLLARVEEAIDFVTQE